MAPTNPPPATVSSGRTVESGAASESGSASGAAGGRGPVRPFREGLISIDPPRLLGSRCGSCALTMFPPREFCPGCREVGELRRAVLDTRGHLHSFTIVRQAPAGMEVPYVLAWVDLPADGVRVMATVVGVEPATVELGLPVELELVPFATDDDGGQRMGFRFRATGKESAA